MNRAARRKLFRNWKKWKYLPLSELAQLQFDVNQNTKRPGYKIIELARKAQVDNPFKDTIKKAIQKGN